MPDPFDPAFAGAVDAMAQSAAAKFRGDPYLIVQNDRYPLSPRIVALKEILGQLRPEPEREPLSPRRNYEPPRGGRYRRR